MLLSFTSLFASVLSLQGGNQPFPFVYSNNLNSSTVEFILDGKMLGYYDHATQEEIVFSGTDTFIFSYFPNNPLESSNPDTNELSISVYQYDYYGLGSQTKKLLKRTFFKIDSQGYEDGQVKDVIYTLHQITGLDSIRLPTEVYPTALGIEVVGNITFDESASVGDKLLFYQYQINLNLTSNFQDVFDKGYNTGYSDGHSQGYNVGVDVGYNKGFGDGAASGDTPSINWIRKVFDTINNILNIELFPNFKLSYIIGIFIIFPVLSWIIHWFRG